MLMRKPKNKKFEYTPRFYKPELDEENNKKINFRANTSFTRRKNTMVMVFILLILIYFLIRLSVWK